jgi:hypothetical protein
LQTFLTALSTLSTPSFMLLQLIEPIIFNKVYKCISESYYGDVMERMRWAGHAAHIGKRGQYAWVS